MQGTRISERTSRTSDRSLAAEVSAVICGLLAAGLLGWLGLLVYDMGETYGNVTGAGLPSIAGVVALFAASFGAAAVSLWTHDSRKTLLTFIGALLLGAVAFGVVWLVL